MSRALPTENFRNDRSGWQTGRLRIYAPKKPPSTRRENWTRSNQITLSQYAFVYNAFSFTIEIMGAATILFFLRSFQIGANYRTAITIIGLVTLIACYHYFRIFSSWEAAFTVVNGVVKPTGEAFNDAYRYVDWLLTVPLLLVELILIMRLPRDKTVKMSVKLGVLAALMVVLGYPGEVSNDPSTRWIFWALTTVPFVSVDRMQYSFGLFVTCFGIDRAWPEVAHHRIVLGERWKAWLDEIFDGATVPDDPSLYLHRPAATDPSLQSPGHDGFYVLAPVPNLRAPIDWARATSLLRDRIVAQLEVRVLPGLSRHIVTERIMTPVDFATDYLSHHGAG